MAGTIKDSYRRVFDPANPDSTRVLRHICKVGCVTDTTYVKGDPIESAMNEGARRLALSILRAVYGSDLATQQAIQSFYETTIHPPTS